MANLPGTLTARDVSLHVSSPLIRTEKRISPSWTVSHLKGRLETVTGIPPSSMKLTLKFSGSQDVEIEGEDKEMGTWITGLNPASAELVVSDLRPLAQRNLDLLDASSVEKYTMPEQAYEGLSDSVLAWKKANKLGRFDPHAPEHAKQKADTIWTEAQERGIEAGKRCQIGEDSSRRGTVRFVGEVKEIPGLGGPWVGVELDEPAGKNDGSVGGVAYFSCPAKHGVFVRPERVVVGDFKSLLDEDDDMEEI